MSPLSNERFIFRKITFMAYMYFFSPENKMRYINTLKRTGNASFDMVNVKEEVRHRRSD